MSAARRMRLGAVLSAVGIIALLLAFGPAKFADRLSGRVDAPAVVQWGVSQDAVSGDDRIDDGSYGAWKVDYEIDGSPHTGILLGTYREGQRITVSAPSDGSVFALLHEAPSPAVKILSWFLAPLAVVAIVAGVWYFVGGLRMRDAAAKQVAREQLARRYPHLFPPPAVGGSPGPARPSMQASPEPRGTEPGRQPTRHDFYAPYDL